MSQPQSSFSPMLTPDPPQSTLEVVAPFVAEFVGTFMLVFTVGTCSVAGDAAWNATAIAALLMVMVYTMGPVSGGHLNPSVSLACGLAGKTPWSKVAGYICSQVGGGLLAGWLYYEVFNLAAAVGPKNGYGWFHVGVVELAYTAMLCFVVLNCATSARNNPKDDQNHFFALAIGFVIVAGGYAAGDISGGCFNPAVTLGLDVVGKGGAIDSQNWWRAAYCGYQVLGAGLAVLLFHVCRYKEPTSTAGQSGGGTVLQLHILSASNLRNRDSGFMGDVSDPYVTARVGLTEHRTPTINNNLNPIWTSDNNFLFSLGGTASSIDGSSLLTLEVMNDNAIRKEQSLGACTVDLRDLPVEEWMRRKEHLLGGRDGQLDFELRLSTARSDFEPIFVSKVLSEFLGTFTLVLTVGLNIVMKSPATPWSAAAALMCMIYSLGNVSGAHFNPAVTLGAVLSRRGVCSPSRGLAYVMAQLLAGVLAGLLYADFHYVGPYKDELFGLAPGASVQTPGEFYSWWAVFVAELAFTFMLVFVVLAVATTTPARALTEQNFQFALAIGSCVTAGGFAIGAISGGELNPAVSFGIATASHSSSGRLTPAPWYYCLYFGFFELAGGVVAALVFSQTHGHEYKKSEGLLSY